MDNVESKLKGYVKRIAELNPACRNRANRAAESLANGDIVKSSNGSFKVRGRHHPYYLVSKVKGGWACQCYDYRNPSAGNMLNNKANNQIIVCKHTLTVMMHIKLLHNHSS